MNLNAWSKHLQQDAERITGLLPPEGDYPPVLIVDNGRINVVPIHDLQQTPEAWQQALGQVLPSLIVELKGQMAAFVFPAISKTLSSEGVDQTEQIVVAVGDTNGGISVSRATVIRADDEPPKLEDWEGTGAPAGGMVECLQLGLAASSASMN